MIRYKTKGGPPWVTAVECPEKGYPNKDINGEIQFENIYFDDEWGAWKRVIENAKCAQDNAVEDYKAAKEHLDDKTKRLADRATQYTLVYTAFEEWEREAEIK
jgi:hypothetical protein